MVGKTFSDRRLGQCLGHQEDIGGAGPGHRGHGIKQIFRQFDGLPNCGQDHVRKSQGIGAGVGATAVSGHPLIDCSRRIRHRTNHSHTIQLGLKHGQRHTGGEADNNLTGTHNVTNLVEQVLDIFRLHRDDQDVPARDGSGRIKGCLDGGTTLGLASPFLAAYQQDDVFRFPAGSQQTLSEDLAHRTCAEDGDSWVSHSHDDTCGTGRVRTRPSSLYAPLMEQRPAALEPTLLWIVTGYRIFAALWLSILGGVALASEATAVGKPGVVGGTIVLVLTWSALTTALRVFKPGLTATWWLVGLDLAISCWTIIAGDVAETIQFAGGYPLVGAFTAIYAFGWAGGVAGAAALTATGLSRVIDGNDFAAQDVANSIAHLFSVGAATGVAAALRTSEHRRAAAEAALEQERTDRIRAEEHAEMAAHLHDSVLQTLALIQRDSGATPDIRGLARHQERELRSWLFSDQESGTGTAGGFRETLVAACSEIEDLGEAKVEVVVVGDSTATVEPIIRAAREAIRNASKHSGAETISVYGEAGDGAVQVFVKDRGVGFDSALVPESRQGIRESIVSRMERHGGTAEIISQPGAGTEIRLRLPTGDQ